jgi:hypothetical protein
MYPNMKTRAFNSFTFSSFLRPVFARVPIYIFVLLLCLGVRGDRDHSHKASDTSSLPVSDAGRAAESSAIITDHALSPLWQDAILANVLISC